MVFYLSSFRKEITILADELIAKKIKNLEGVFKKNPDLFEILREELIEMAIISYPERYRKRARGIQFFIDHELNRHKDPVIRMNRMIELFWDKFHEFNATINDPVGMTIEREKNKKNGKILPLH